jgi:HK97 family phage portal protein
MLDRLRAVFRPQNSYGTLEERAFADAIRSLNASGVVVTEETALAISAVWSCVRVIAESIAMLPVDVIEKTNGRREVLHDHPVAWLTNFTSDGEIDAYQFREAMLFHALMRRGGYAEIERDLAGRPIAMHLLAPERVAVARREEDGALGYNVQNAQGITWVPARNIFHLRGPSPDGTDAYRIVALAQQSFGMASAMETFGASFFGNGAQLGTRYTTDATLKKEQIDALREQIEKLHGGAAKAFKAAILHSGLKVMETTMPLRDAQFLEARRFQVLEVARWFRVPPHLLAELDRATHANVEQEQLAFVAHCLQPWARRFEAEANLKLFGRNQQGRQVVKLNLSALLRGDIKSRFEAYQIARRNGWLNANEIRTLEDMNPIGDEGEVYIVEANMTTIERIEEPPEPPPSLPARTSAAGGEDEGEDGGEDGEDGAEDAAGAGATARAWGRALAQFKPVLNVVSQPATTIVESPTVHAHISLPEREVHIAAPEVKIESPVTVTVPERSVVVDHHAGDVHVASPEVRVESPVTVTVPEREVTVESPVTVQVPEREVTMHHHAGDVLVQVPEESDVEQRVLYNKDGDISRVIKSRVRKKRADK